MTSLNTPKDIRDTPSESTIQLDAKGASWSLGASPAVVSLILLNIIVFLALPIVFGSRFPYRRESLGVLWGPLVFGGEWWRVLAYSFVHFELSHVLPNMLGLWLVGTPVEREFGKWIFLSFYLVCGVVAGLTVLALHPFTAVDGASGAVAGLAGGVISIYAPRFRSLARNTRVKLGILILYATGLVTAEFARGEFYLAHTAGLATGVVLGGIFVYVVKTKRGICWTLVAATLIMVIAAAAIQRYHQ